MAIFRTVSLERLASPEQLDQVMRVTTARSWLALVASLLMVCVGVLWGFVGSVPTTVSGAGAIVRRGGVLNVVTRGSGLVMSLDVSSGEHVRANQVVARIAQPAMLEKITLTKNGLAEAQRRQKEFALIHQSEANLKIEAAARQEANDEAQIKELEAQAKLAGEQIPVEEELLAKGLVTKQQTIAAQQKLVTIQGQIANLRAQIKQLHAQSFGYQSQPAEADADIRARIFELQSNMAQMEKELELSSSVVTPYAGQILELKAYPGSTVEQGTPIVSIQPDTQDLEVLIYVPSLRAKEIKSGVEAQVSPSTVKREEFGYIKGTVTHVAEFPATRAALMRNFENEALVTALASAGPVTELTIALSPNPDTASGFLWSSPKGPPLAISAGTLCSAQIVTRRQRPITLLLPYIRERLGLG